MEGNFVCCKYCGATFELSGEFCPNCHMTVQIKRSLFDFTKNKFHKGSLPHGSSRCFMGGAFILAIILCVYAVYELVTAPLNAADYQRTYSYVNSEQYEEDRALFDELLKRGGNWYGSPDFTPHEQYTYEKLRDSVGLIPDNIHVLLAKYDDYVVYNRVAVYVLFAAVILLIVSIIFAFKRYRVSLVMLSVTAVLGLLALTVLCVWTFIGGYTDFPVLVYVLAFTSTGLVARYSLEARAALDPDKEDMMPTLPKKKKKKPREEDFPKPVGASMPKVQELYSFEDMPELSGMKAFEEAKAAEEAKKAEEAKAAEEAKKAEEAKAAEEAKKAEEARREKTDEVTQENAANDKAAPASAEERPMITLDMRHVAALTAMGVCLPSGLPVKVADASSYADEDIWFCDVCGSLNESGTVCSACKTERNNAQ